MKAVRIARLKSGVKQALLDSGSTHVVRKPKIQEEWEEARWVRVELAAGETAQMKMTSEGTVLSQGAEQPLIPLMLLSRIGCAVVISTDGMQLTHPTRGIIPVCCTDNAPQIS